MTKLRVISNYIDITNDNLNKGSKKVKELYYIEYYGKKY